ncbi:ComEB Deoxycytidylate deaminase [uncultured Caudovirales phage]|uniref:ComEB Deoxycytidylate deaminase n=1 Tax=uncultured Caudovirales phage TaxID=2100421 RepID=A0A6J5MEI4_9CAUD|nr:ComEB Deoxycytidylate deaminase [uncultured Caudovirales phage]
MVNWDKRFLELAEHVAQWSKDPRTKVGAVIVDEKKRVVSVGYNGFPRGVHDDPDRYEDRTTKHLFVAHAERNALDNAPLMVDGCTIYVPLLPCNECAKSIIQKGIIRVVTYAPDRDGTMFNWDITRKMFYEAGVKLVEHSK